MCACLHIENDKKVYCLDSMIVIIILSNLILMTMIDDKGWREWCFAISIISTVTLMCRVCNRYDIQPNSDNEPMENDGSPVSQGSFDGFASFDSAPSFH